MFDMAFCYVILKLQVLALDKRYLDPRRSVNPTQSEKEEGIIPLTDSLPIIPQVCFPFIFFFFCVVKNHNFLEK